MDPENMSPSVSDMPVFVLLEFTYNGNYQANLLLDY